VNKIPVGFCQCGCGQRTNKVKQDDPKRGYKKGDYRRYVNHHASNKNHLIPKICTICGKKFLPQKRSRQHTQETCSAHCRNISNGRKSAKKIRAAHVDKGEGKSYRKYHGRHEHRVVMERKLGRKLKRGEIVHHIDGDKRNNHPDNLKLLSSQSEHASLHGYKRWKEWRNDSVRNSTAKGG